MESAVTAGANRVVDAFRNCLNVIPANSRHLLDCVFRLRYQVYCIERGYFDAGRFPDCREQDADDHRSTHYLLLNKTTGVPIGTVRMIMPEAGVHLPALQLLPPARRESVRLPMQSTVEVSRFAVSKIFRRGMERRDRDSAWAPRAETRSTLPLLTLGLVQAVLMMSLSGGATHFVAIMEPALIRLLARLGIDFHPIGEPIHHHGLRQPGWAKIDDVVARVRICHPELWDLATEAYRKMHVGDSSGISYGMSFAATAAAAAPAVLV